jgi:peptidoglycan/LPS O-acetylase OafA/YrhL
MSESKPARSGFLHHVHDFRTVAIIGIVAAHALHNFAFDHESLSFRFADALANESSIWFFFIAGLLFQHLSKNFKLGKYFNGKLKNVILPYVLLSIPAIFASVTFFEQDMPTGFYDLPIVAQVVLFLATGKHLAPFWFVPTISLIYLLASLLLAADNRKWPYFLLPGLLILSTFLGRDGIQIITGWGGYASPISKAVYLFSPYCLGMFCGRYHQEVLSYVRRWQVPLLAIAAASLAAHLGQFTTVIKFEFIFKITTALLILYYLSVFSGNPFRRIPYVGEVSFGIFFVHGYLLAATKLALPKAGLDPLMPANWFLYIAFTLVILVLSCLLLWIAQKVFGKYSRQLVGA